MKAILQRFSAGNAAAVPHIAGILFALRTAYSAGYLGSVTELVHADIFADFVEMADYLLSEGYKDPSAVIIGSTLEEHLRQLCIKHGIPTDTAGRPKKADQIGFPAVKAISYPSTLLATSFHFILLPSLIEIPAICTTSAA
jgi:hypothetical protein